MMGETDKLVAEQALALSTKLANIQADSPEVELWHLLRALLEWCDAQHPRIDFDRVLEDVRADFNA